ncbi:hypothetical protein JB92DRAFT_2835876 [Gautieria morchelliformis]|nr:hypothetical protein JB92DRAFT_2835876 [Gautieria morchelliformis]
MSPHGAAACSKWGPRHAAVEPMVVLVEVERLDEGVNVDDVGRVVGVGCSRAGVSVCEYAWDTDVAAGAVVVVVAGVTCSRVHPTAGPWEPPPLELTQSDRSEAGLEVQGLLSGSHVYRRGKKRSHTNSKRQLSWHLCLIPHSPPHNGRQWHQCVSAGALLVKEHSLSYSYVTMLW